MPPAGELRSTAGAATDTRPCPEFDAMLGRYYWRTGCVRRDGEECWRAGTPQRHLGNSAPGILGPLYFLPGSRHARRDLLEQFQPFAAAGATRSYGRLRG